MRLFPALLCFALSPPKPPNVYIALDGNGLYIYTGRLVALSGNVLVSFSG